MRSYINQLSLLARRLLMLYFFYFLLRLLFLLFNFSFFSFNSFSELAFTFVLGLRFDTSAIVISNSLFILLSILPLPFFATRAYQVLLKTVYLVFNAFFILMNCADFSYFKFVHKRTAADFFDLFSLGNDMSNTLPKIFADFWYLLAIWAVIMVLAALLFGKTRLPGLHTAASRPKEAPASRRPNGWLRTVQLIAMKIVLMAVVGFACIVAARGGIQLRPLRMIAASEYTSPGNVPLVLNTTFSIITSYGKATLEEPDYLDTRKAESLFNPLKRLESERDFTPYNVVFIIVESLSKEYCGFLNDYEGYTPFLDSLADHSLVCLNGFANTRVSMEGIPAATASLPALMEEPFITSRYNGNKINSLASALKKEGYSSGFFHGGNNGTMGFDTFSKAAGFDFYKGRKEYGNHDYDGHWGVYDHSFYRFFIAEMNAMKQPFMNVLFTLSSHHPFTVPSYFQTKFEEGSLPIHKCVRYADYSLRLFFEQAKRQAWFNQTLFVITADHSGPNELPAYQTKKGIYEIPIMYFMPGSPLKGRFVPVTQQTDIMPTVLGLLHYQKPFVAFGNNIFDTGTPRMAVNYFDGIYQLVNDSVVIQYDGENLTGVYFYKNDPLLTNNRAATGKTGLAGPLQLLQSYLQQFNRRMITNTLAQ